MTKEQLIIRLGGIEWDDFEAKTAKSELPKNIWVQKNPGGFIVPVSKVLQEAISLPRNPIIIKLFRFAKLSENAGYGIDKMKRWTTLTGKNVGFRSDVTHATVTYFKKFDIIDGVNDPINDGVNDPINRNDGNFDPINDPINQNEGEFDPINDPINHNDGEVDSIKNIEEIATMIEEIDNNSQITYEELQCVANCSRATIRRTLKKLRQYGLLVREGSRKTGHWIVTEKGKNLLKTVKKQDK